MGSETIVSLVGLALQITTAIVLVVWAMASMKSTTAQLSTTMNHLATAVGELRDAVETLRTKIDNHGERLARLETKVNIPYGEES